MSKGRRTLMLAVAGLFISTGVAQEPESRAATRPADSRALALERLREIVGPPRAVVRPAPPGTDSRPSLQRVEAELLLESARLEASRTYDAAATTLQHELRAGGGAPDAGAQRILVEAIAESDALVAKVETREFEAKIGERDMLSAKERAPWGASAGAKLTWSGREMSIEGVPIEKGKVTGVVSMLPTKAAPWHDIVLDLEFTILSGDFEMYLRYWPDRKAYKIRFGPRDGYELNKPYRMTIRVKGSDVSLSQPDQPENRDRIQPSTSRTGGIGFGLTPGFKAVISRLGMKVLR
jgi:hypothetical protein